MDFAVYAHTDIALLVGILKHLNVLALLAADDRRKQLHTRLFFKRHQPVNDLSMVCWWISLPHFGSAAYRCAPTAERI